MRRNINIFKKGVIKKSIAIAAALIFLAGVAGGGMLVSSIKDLSHKTSLSKVFSGFSKSWQKAKESAEIKEKTPYTAQTLQEERIIKVVEESAPAVVSIIVSKQVAVYKEYYEDPFEEFRDLFGDSFGFKIKIPRYKKEGTTKKKVGGGTGFIISKDGLILTNKHVVIDEKADYTVVSSSGRKYKAKVLARDPLQDLAILKIEGDKKIGNDGKVVFSDFPTLPLGDSDNLKIGQTVIAIGNALGEFRNTVSVGVISGLGRRITATGGGIVESLEDIIQTDAAINRGNSGGPLLNLKGEVIGVNVAMAQGAQSIGFSIPINKAKKDITQIKSIGKIVYPFLGVRCLLITPEIQSEKNLGSDYGALIVRGQENEPGVVEGSAAQKAGLREGDIILSVNGERVDQRNSLSRIIQKYKPGDKVVLEILRGDKKMKIEAVLGEKTSS